MNAMDMMIKTVVDAAMKNMPPETLQQIGQIGQVVTGLRAQLDRIENQNRLIIAFLNIPAETQIMEIDENDRLPEQFSGTESR